MKYAEQAVQQNYRYKPASVFAIDPPLDFERFYNAEQRNIRLSRGSQPNREAVYMITRCEKEIGGTPPHDQSEYFAASPYSFNDTTQQAIKNLVHTPVMLISEPDVNWWLTERGYDFTGMNVTDGAAMVNELNRLGNNNAVLITTAGKGFRDPGHRRHPHSWSIADPATVVDWLFVHSR